MKGINSKIKVAKVEGIFTYKVTKDRTKTKTTYNVTKDVTYKVVDENIKNLIESNNIKIAKKMIDKKIPTEDVIEITGLPKEKILNLLKTAWRKE